MKTIRILIMLAVASILSTTVTSAQISVGAGYLYQSLGEKTAGDYVASHINFDGFYVGADFGIKCGKIFSVVPGIYYEFLDGARAIMTYGSSWREHYLKIPVDFRFGFNIGRAVRIFAGVGPKLHIGLASHLRSAIASINFYDLIDEYASSYNAYGRFDILLGLNVGVEIARHYRIMLGYDYGLLNRAKNMDSNVAHNQQFNIGVAYVF